MPMRDRAPAGSDDDRKEAPPREQDLGREPISIEEGPEGNWEIVVADAGRRTKRRPLRHGERYRLRPTADGFDMVTVPRGERTHDALPPLRTRVGSVSAEESARDLATKNEMNRRAWGQK
jgi:hypothetical protein